MKDVSRVDQNDFGILDRFEVRHLFTQDGGAVVSGRCSRTGVRPQDLQSGSAGVPQGRTSGLSVTVSHSMEGRLKSRNFVWQITLQDVTQRPDLSSSKSPTTAKWPRFGDDSFRVQKTRQVLGEEAMVKKTAEPVTLQVGTIDSVANKRIFRLSSPGRGRALVAAAIIALVLVVLGGVVRPGTSMLSLRQALVISAKAASSPALSDAEESYIRALWPIHGDVERSAVRVSLGTIFYKTGDLDKAELKNRLEAALVAYQRAEGRISELKPPPSFARMHDDYVAAIHLFEQATVEALKMFSDGDDAHLVLAHPLSHEGSNKIREIGGRFWRDEFPPN